MIWIYILSFAALICAIIALVTRDNKPNAISVALSSVALVAAFAALALVAPRSLEPSNMSVDYLGIIVAILAAFATLLLAMQLYTVFGLKEDAKKVVDARDVIDRYAEQVLELEEKIKKLEEQAENAVYFVDDDTEETPDVAPSVKIDK